jgi:hypothetical protein
LATGLENLDDKHARSGGEGTKRLRHPAAALEYSAFAVDSRPDVGMVRLLLDGPI